MMESSRYLKITGGTPLKKGAQAGALAGLGLIYPDGRVEMKAQIPAISKTLMSQTKDYRLDEKRTIVKTYIRSENKFRTDLHTHMNANLHPDILIALGICHQIRYPLYYIKKLGLRCSKEQEEKLAERRQVSAEKYKDCGLTGKYMTRRIDDNTFLNFADLILNDPEDAAFNIPRIRRSLAILKDGQAVFTNLEKVYLYRYVFCKGQAAEDPIELDPGKILRIPDLDIRESVMQILADRHNPEYRNNTLFMDKQGDGGDPAVFGGDPADPADDRQGPGGDRRLFQGESGDAAGSCLRPLRGGQRYHWRRTQQYTGHRPGAA